MKKIYFAGPLFCKAEKDYNLTLTHKLEKAGYRVFLPQRDGFEATLLSGLSEAEKAKKIFEKDLSEIRSSDVLFMVLDGRVPDDGACVELGYAFAKGKPCYGIKTDVRAMEKDLDLNPMLSECFVRIFKDGDGRSAETDLTEYLEKTEL